MFKVDSTKRDLKSNLDGNHLFCTILNTQILILNSILNIVHWNLIAQTAKVKLTLKFYKMHIRHTL